MPTIPLDLPGVDLATPRPEISVADVCGVAVLLLGENRDLQARVRSAVLTTGEVAVRVELAGVEASLVDVAWWAHRYGGVLFAETRADTDGRRFRDCWTTFEFHGHRVEVHVELSTPGGFPNHPFAGQVRTQR